MTNITCKSYWKKGDKKCTVNGTREMNCIDYTFWISGWNPLPCKEFTGSYSVLANWLKDNGWEREISISVHNPNGVRQMNVSPEKIAEALQLIREICKAHRCATCPFTLSNGDCGIVDTGTMPEDWNINSPETWKAF